MCVFRNINAGAPHNFIPIAIHHRLSIEIRSQTECARGTWRKKREKKRRRKEGRKTYPSAALLFHSFCASRREKVNTDVEKQIRTLESTRVELSSRRTFRGFSRWKGNADGQGRRAGRREYRLRAGTSLILSKEKIRRKVICGGEFGAKGGGCCEVIAQSLWNPIGKTRVIKPRNYFAVENRRGKISLRSHWHAFTRSGTFSKNKESVTWESGKEFGSI